MNYESVHLRLASDWQWFLAPLIAEVLIKRRGGAKPFSLRSATKPSSPFDVPGVKTRATTADVLAATRSGEQARKRPMTHCGRTKGQNESARSPFPSLSRYPLPCCNLVGEAVAMLPLLLASLERRRPLWIALSCMFLDSSEAAHPMRANISFASSSGNPAAPRRPRANLPGRYPVHFLTAMYERAVQREEDRRTRPCLCPP